MSSTPGCHLDFQALVQTHSLFARQHLEDLQIGEGLRSIPKLTQRTVRLTNWEDADVGCHILGLCVASIWTRDYRVCFRHGVTVTMCVTTRVVCLLFRPNRSKYDTPHTGMPIPFCVRLRKFGAMQTDIYFASLPTTNTVAVRGKSHDPAL